MRHHESWGLVMHHLIALIPQEKPMLKFQVMTLMIFGDLKEKRNERGATATEYGLLVAFIALAIIVGVTAFGGALNGFFNELKAKVDAW